MYIVNTAKEILNCRNHKGHMVLEILELSPGNAESKQSKKAVKAAAGKSTELLPLLAGAQETNSRQQTLENSKDILETKNRSLLQYLIDIGNGCELPFDFKLGYQPEVVPTPSSTMSAKSRKDSELLLLQAQTGVFQEGPLKGKSTVRRTTAFKVFTVSNNIAFFTSLCIVVVLVSIIPFQRKQMMKMLVITHKVMWVAVLFMAIAYIAATWVTTQNCRESGWMFEVLLAISAGTVGTVFLYLAIVLTRHWLRKLKWREEKGKRRRTTATIQDKAQSQHDRTNAEGEIYSESTISDVDSSTIRISCILKILNPQRIMLSLSFLFIWRRVNIECQTNWIVLLTAMLIFTTKTFQN
ncbi:uncharacterized protein LOC116116900 [Pistacia vera]|uniref:uncharacterized protein LOC116116900 n=1 Tax=Pistacia vera TaxID=55513 RepID=UPI001263E639|nr:uncharacterized protein LOC116116900 [Pistacia vera]